MVGNLSLTEECYSTLRSLIVNCEIPPGTRLTEKEIIERTGFGRTPVREALARLDVEGMVLTRPRSGYSVTEVNTKTVTDFFDVWKVIGPLIVRRAAENISEEGLSEIDELLDTYSPDDPIETLLRRNEQIFQILVDATENRDLIFIHKRLVCEQGRIFAMHLNTEEGREWLASANQAWHGKKWYESPDLVEARTVFLIESAYSSVLKLVKGSDFKSGEQQAGQK